MKAKFENFDLEETEYFLNLSAALEDEHGDDSKQVQNSFDIFVQVFSLIVVFLTWIFIDDLVSGSIIVITASLLLLAQFYPPVLFLALLSSLLTMCFMLWFDL